MTDGDMTFEIGKRLVQLHQENLVLKGILMNIRDPGGPIPWQFYLDEGKKAPLSFQNAQNALLQLQQVVDNTGDCTSLLRSLHDHILRFPVP
jgi:hypothetical protein